ncbi:cytochrome P450 [Rhodanobacter sp. 7MK24]|uniref:cytochrome P450 n=1 Tax=Rhodanobacter sp. 7MK24 TaxID=2775922 RepID=UPI00178121F6|nr:cytochrome P450 [Rhodanobacter sp. 7MK24]MBD8879927.1 cytochrome P450 [Rhodanobacter sp. 7MK24]
MTSQQATVRPWPLGLPLLQAIRRDPFGFVAQLRARHGDTVKLKVLSTDIYYLFRPEAARQVLVNHQDDFVKDQRVLEIMQSVHGANVITTEGAAWERQRRILAPAFAPKRIAACAALMAAAADECAGRELPAQTGASTVVDVEGLTTRITMDVILRALFSYRYGLEEAATVSGAIRALSRQLMRELFWPLRPAAWLPYPGRTEKARSLAVIHDLIRARIEARRRDMANGADAGEDILGLMLAARDEQAEAPHAALSDAEVLNNCVGLFGAGHDTSATALTWWVGLMAAHPEIAAQVRDEVRGLPDDHAAAARDIAEARLLNATIKEAMRLYPPSVATFSRRALRNVEIDGHTIVKGVLVIVPIWNLHRDERWFPEPDAFRPERFLPGAPALPRNAFMPFGVGPHFCLGQQFAMVEMALIAARLIRRHDFSLDHGTDLPAPMVDLVLKPRERLQVRFTRLA